MDWKFNNEKTRIILDKPQGRPKKITATRLGSILGLNPWQSPFSAWCDICKVYKEPFEDTKYTIAGKVIEPIITDWAKEEFDEGVVSPEDFYGNTWKTVQRQYDFYKDTKVFGGMWDAKIINSKRDTVAVIEIKTSSRPQDWEDGVPDEKLVQALQYGYLEGAKRTFVIVAFLNEEDYQHPSNFVPVLGKNIKLYPFDTLSTTIMFDNEPTTIDVLIDYAKQWWEAYVLTGVSPEFNDKVDEKILKELRTQRPDEDGDSTLIEMVTLLNSKEAELAYIRETKHLDDLEVEIKQLKDALKRVMIDGMGEDDKEVQVGTWNLSKSEKSTVDTTLLKEDGLYEKYLKTSVSYTLRKKGEK